MNKFICKGCKGATGDFKPCELFVDPDNPFEVPTGCIRNEHLPKSAKWVFVSPEKPSEEQWNTQINKEAMDAAIFREMVPKKEGEPWDRTDWEWAVDWGIWVREKGNPESLEYFELPLAFQPKTGDIYLGPFHTSQIEVCFNFVENQWYTPDGDIMKKSGANPEEDEDDSSESPEWE